MKHEISPDLLKRYLRGEATPDESAIIDEWYQSQEKAPDDIRLQNSDESAKIEKLIFDRIKANLSFHENEFKLQQSSSVPVYPLFKKSIKWAAAISAIAVVGIGAFLYFIQKQHHTLTSERLTTVGQLKRISNNTSSIQHQQLEDGTLINLHPNSSIEFPETFAVAQREIKLTGEAFFDVAKDKNRPFIITTDNITVKVLGTSFNVKAYQGAKEITVAVRTGRVSVCAKNASHQNLNDVIKEIILTPNQKVVYNTAQENFSKKLVDNPQIILAKPTLYEMQYDGAPVIKILDALEENYGIDIVYNRVMLSGCVVTTSMAEEGFYERIEIICKTINAQYEIKDDKIFIRSNGCQ